MISKSNLNDTVLKIKFTARNDFRENRFLLFHAYL